MIMCNDCNRTHKKTAFPLEHNFIATEKSVLNFMKELKSKLKRAEYKFIKFIAKKNLK